MLSKHAAAGAAANSTHIAFPVVPRIFSPQKDSLIDDPDLNCRLTVVFQMIVPAPQAPSRITHISPMERQNLLRSELGIIMRLPLWKRMEALRCASALPLPSAQSPLCARLDLQPSTAQGWCTSI